MHEGRATTLRWAYLRERHLPLRTRGGATAKLHPDKIDEEKLKLKDKFYYNYINWKLKAESEYEKTIEDLGKQLHESKYDEEGNYHKYTLAEANKWVKVLKQQLEIAEQKCNSYYDMYLQERRRNSYFEHYMIEKGCTKEEISEKRREFMKEYYDETE